MRLQRKHMKIAHFQQKIRDGSERVARFVKECNNEPLTPYLTHHCTIRENASVRECFLSQIVLL